MSIWDQVGRFFGSAQNNQFALLMRDQSQTAVECMRLLRRTAGRDLAGIVELERKADATCDAVHELLDNSFIMRFDIPDSMRLCDSLDDVVDGMRKVAQHVDIYRPHLDELRPEAHQLLEVGERMIASLDALIGMLAGSRLDLAEVRDAARAIDEAESEADRILAQAERNLVAEFSPPGANRLAFIALDKLYHLLEEMTDDTNRCAKQVLSLARKEA